MISYRYGGSVQFLATESRETSPEDVVLFSKAYPGVVCDVRSFFGWRGRRATIPWTGRLVFSSSPVSAFLLPHSHGAYDSLPAVKQTPAPHQPHSAPRASPLRIIIAHHANMLPPAHASGPTTRLATLPTRQNPQHAVFSKFYANRITDSRCVLSRVAPCTRADHHGHTSPLLDVSRPPSTRSDAFRHILRPLRRPAHPNIPSRHVSQHNRPAIHPHPHTVRPSESYSPRWSDVARPALCTGLANGCWMPHCPTRARRPQS